MSVTKIPYGLAFSKESKAGIGKMNDSRPTLFLLKGVEARFDPVDPDGIKSCQRNHTTFIILQHQAWEISARVGVLMIDHIAGGCQ